MDNSELHYLTYDPEEIWSEMIAAYIDAGGDILYPGDEKEMLLRSVQADIVQIFAGVDNALRMQTLRYAVGPYLDVIGELRGCDRIAAKPAKATVTITAHATGQSDVLEAGTSMTADGKTFYALTEDLALTGDDQTAEVDVECTEDGSVGNALLAGMEMKLAITNLAIDSITVSTSASGGMEEETDDAYRERIREHGLTTVSTGPYQQYESAAKSVSSEIVDARALNGGGGNVDIYLIFANETGKAAIIQDVTSALSDKSTRPLTDHVQVYEAASVAYTLNIQYACDNSSDTTAAIEAAVADYKKWQDETVGRAFNPDRLVAALYQSGCTRISWMSGSEFGAGGPIEYTEIAPNKRCKGTITLIAAHSA